MRPTTAGPRQTVERVVHPNRGDGWAVYDNGPGAFVTLDGVSTAMRIRLGGADMNGWWRNAEDPEHGWVRLTGVSRGEMHNHWWHQFLGYGWFVFEVSPSKGAWARFEADDGHVLARFQWSSVSVGTPEYRNKMNRSRSKMPKMSPEDEHYRTFVLADGSVMAFRDSPPPPQEAELFK